MNQPTRDKLRELIQHKLKRDIIEPSTSPSSSTILLVPKPTGGVRFVKDYRALNKAVGPDAYTLPAVDESLASRDLSLSGTIQKASFISRTAISFSHLSI
jgi:hypothetical protein